MVDEVEFRSAYERINPIRCVFEKTLTSLNGQCGCATHFWLADREGYACEGETQAHQCEALLKTLREKSRFLFKMHEIDSPLPHNKEIRVQCGGLRGLAKLLLNAQPVTTVENINGLVNAAVKKYGDTNGIPFDEVMPSIAEFKPRSRHRR